MEKMISYLNGIPTTGWILFVVVIVLFFIATLLIVSAFKKQKKNSKRRNEIINFLTLSIPKDEKWLEEIVKKKKTQPKRYGTALQYIKGTGVHW